MIASTFVAAALASTNPAQATPAPVHDHGAMAASHAHTALHQEMAGHDHKAGGKMACCKDGCECCAKKDGKAEAKPAG